jgi:azurin
MSASRPSSATFFRARRPARDAIRRLLLLWLSAGSGVSADQVQNPSAAERFQTPSAELVRRENTFWRRTPLTVPEVVVLEVTGIAAVASRRLLVTTRRGEVWWVDDAYAEGAAPTFSLFAEGLHEPLGIVPAPAGGYYVAQRQELTRLVDTDKDGRADLFETVCTLPLSGSYHEYAFGPVLALNGNLRLTLNVAFDSATQAPVPWRGWMVEITPDGQLTPEAAGLRSPCGFLQTAAGDWFCSENQGEWVGSGRITHIAANDFAGHPASLAWSAQPGSAVKLRPRDIRDFDEPMHEVAKRVPGLKPPAVWLPHTVLGIATSGIVEDRTGGKFGPFAGQLFVGDQGQSKITRVSLEKVKGVWQGAAYPFREGFDSGIIRIAFGEEGVMFVGESARGWGSVGPKQQGLERLAWTGKMPFEIKEVVARPDGFVLTFTQPVDPTIAANPNSYRVAGFTYLYHKAYGSAPVNRMACPVRKVVLAPDLLSVRLAVTCLREGYVHEIKATPLRAARGEEGLLHPVSYYTLNRLPDGDRIVPIEPDAPELCITPIPPAATAVTKKHPSVAPAEWSVIEGEQTIILNALPGLKFDSRLLMTKPGTRLRFVLRNTDDMLHNFVLCAPGRGQAVSEAALALGIDGPLKNYVPESGDVLYHTAVIQPETSDTLFFAAPTQPGDYDFICSFPGHATSMKGILRVEAQ